MNPMRAMLVSSEEVLEVASCVLAAAASSPLLGSRNYLQPFEPASRQPFFQRAHKPRGQESVCDTARIAPRDWTEIRSGPNEIIGFDQHNPRPLAVESKAIFRTGWNFQRI
jgi:hypothetical protein